jgi:hypothetical protein
MSMIQPNEENEILENSVSQLARKYAGKFDESEIRPIVKESFDSFADAKVRTFVPVFTTRYADDRLRALGFRTLPPRGGIVTNELIGRLREQEGV